LTTTGASIFTEPMKRIMSKRGSRARISRIACGRAVRRLRGKGVGVRR
jgi:hypothetical protein